MTTYEQVKQLIGNYKFISPYHDKKKYLPFNVTGYSYNDEFPAQVNTVEYKGWTRIRHDGNYSIANIQEMIESGFLIKTNQ